jgi:hypothetical protein
LPNNSSSPTLLTLVVFSVCMYAVVIGSLFTLPGCVQNQREASPYNNDYQCHGENDINWPNLGKDLVYLQWKLKNIEASVRTNEKKIDELNTFLRAELKEIKEFIGNLETVRCGTKEPKSPQVKTAKPNVAEKNNVK